MATITARTAIFSRPATHDINHFQQITAAYTAAGLTAPTPALDIKDRITNAPSVEQVAAALALEALDTTDPEAFYEEALEQIRTAQAAQALKDALQRNLATAMTRSIPRFVEQAAEDLAPTFEKLARELSTAAKKLPPHAPLDMAANVEADTAKEYKAATKALAQLGAYAALYKQPSPNGEPPALLAILPIVSLPEAVQEQTQGTQNYKPVTINEERLTGTRTIRALGIAAKEDIDAALVAIARGDFEGVTLNLATPTENITRRQHASTAHQRKEILKGSGVRVL